MSTHQLYILLSLKIFVLFFVISRNMTCKEKNLSTLAGLVCALPLTGLFFGENRLIGYGLIGIGKILALFDVINKSKKKKTVSIIKQFDHFHHRIHLINEKGDYSPYFQPT